jgi:hypothetical protein
MLYDELSLRLPIAQHRIWNSRYVLSLRVSNTCALVFDYPADPERLIATTECNIKLGCRYPIIPTSSAMFPSSGEGSSPPTPDLDCRKYEPKQEPYFPLFYLSDM